MRMIAWLICLLALTSCAPLAAATTQPLRMADELATLTQPASKAGETHAGPLPATTVSSTPTTADEMAAYAFPMSIDPEGQYLFYLHGRIVEIQGLHAVSEVYGEYEYLGILEALKSYGFSVISEQRGNNADGYAFALKNVEQIRQLLAAGVPPEKITVIGASKGAALAAWVSYLLKSNQVKYILLGSCHPETIKEWRQNGVSLYGVVLSIYESSDEYSGSCQEIYDWSEGEGLVKHEEIILHLGTGHGFLYKPLDVWLLPAIQWARNGSQPK